MSAPSLQTLRYQTEDRARQGLGWLVAHVDELRPAVAITRWTHADRARVAAAECAVVCQSYARLAPLQDRVFVALLADWIEHLAVPELIAWSRSGAPAWYRPLVLTAGALMESGLRIPDLETAVRGYGPPAVAHNAAGRPEHAIETAYWWVKLRRSPDTAALDVACEREIRRLRGEPSNAWTARTLNQAILCQSDFGKTPDQVSHYAPAMLRRAMLAAVDEGDAALAAECAFAWWCLGLEWTDELRPLLATVGRAQRTSGAFVPHLRQTSVGIDQTERCSHATLSAVLGSLALAQMLGDASDLDQAIDHDGSSDVANTVNAAQ